MARRAGPATGSDVGNGARIRANVAVAADDAALRRRIVRALGQAPFRITLYDRGADLVEDLERGQVTHLLICDVDLPGLEVLASVPNHGSALTLIVMVDGSDALRLHRCARLGASLLLSRLGQASEPSPHIP
jgi:DNA-binding NtrC family response regulator